MTQKDFILSIFRFAIVSILLLTPGFSGKAHAVVNLLKIQGRPLEIHAYEDSTMGVFRWQGGETPVQQYFGPYSKGSVIFLNGQDASYKWGGSYFGVADFIPVSHAMLNDFTIETVYDAGTSGVRITQTVSYVNGNSYYKIVWRIANTGETTYNDVRFIHEGDTYFAGDDSSEGHWNAGLGMVYLTNEFMGVAGIMGFYGGINSPAIHFVEDHYGTARSLAESGSLPDTVRSDRHDAGYALQWNRNTLAPGQTWIITAFEKWTESGYVQVIAPADTPIVPGATISMDFQIQNYQDVQDVFNLTLTSAAGWTVSLPEGNSVTVPANSLSTVEATVHAPANVTEETTDTLTLTATSQSDPEISNSDAVAIVVQPPATTKPIGPGSTVSDYEMMSFVHYPTNPAATSVIGLPVDENTLRMGTYDPQTGGYIEYGDDLQIVPGKAYWALFREGFHVSFAGNKVPLDEDFKFELAFNAATGNGWNQIACPNEAAYGWDDVLVVVYGDEGEIIFGPTPISELPTPNDYIDLRLWRWESGTYFDDTDFMEPYNGYWAKAKHTHVSLIFPVNAQTDPAGLLNAFHTVLQKNIFLAKKWIFSPRAAIADSGDTPPMPMASLSGKEGNASSSGGGCFIDMIGEKF
jgi:hypothetical protein